MKKYKHALVKLIISQIESDHHEALRSKELDKLIEKGEDGFRMINAFPYHYSKNSGKHEYIYCTMEK
ncbi:MAG: hypothetical protein NTW16_15010, partial [Bacteroidetes bacterium]|nr:hypothetical protein [Bacteroidota bacterium]